MGGAIGMFAAILILAALPFYLNAIKEAGKAVFAPYADPHKVLF